MQRVAVEIQTAMLDIGWEEELVVPELRIQVRRESLCLAAGVCNATQEANAGPFWLQGELIMRLVQVNDFRRFPGLGNLLIPRDSMPEINMTSSTASW